MHRYLFVLLFFLLCAAPARAQNYDSLLTCTLYESATTEDPRDIDTHSYRRPLVLMFSDLDSDFPILKGNVNETPLQRLAESRDGVLYLAESTQYGNLFFYTIYREQKIVTYSKDYILEGKPQSFKMVGACR